MDGGRTEQFLSCYVGEQLRQKIKTAMSNASKAEGLVICCVKWREGGGSLVFSLLMVAHKCHPFLMVLTLSCTKNPVP